MSISLECAKEHANDPAVLCCRAEEGVVLSSHNLEDPAIFDDLVDSGLLNLDGCLTIKEVIGATLTRTSDSLTPLTKDLINEVQNAFAGEETEVDSAENAAPKAADPEPEMIRSLTRKHYRITEVKRGPETKIAHILKDHNVDAVILTAG